MVIFDENMGTKPGETSESNSELVPIKAREVNMWLVFVPTRGKWMKSDPDTEEVLLDKNFYSAFEFRSLAHAKRAQDALQIEDLDSHIFGDTYAE